MKLIRVGDIGKELPGIELEDGRRLNVSGFGEDFGEAFFSSDGPSRLVTWLEAAGTLPSFDADARYGAPIMRPSKIICVGLNFKRHAQESGMAVPNEPILFFKASSSLCGPNDPVIIPRGGEKTDWEVELALVIGKTCRYVSPDEAMSHVAGFALINDYSERAFQMERGGQWVKGKSCDNFAPLGPYLVTPDQVPDPHNLDMWLSLNGEKLQDSNTNDFIFDLPFVVSYISQFMTLLPGDVIATGTPEGVGLGFKPPRYLKPGDLVELGITGLGKSRQHVINAD